MTILVQQQITEADRKQLRELCDKATQGDWWIDSHGHRMVSRPRFDTVFEASSNMGPAIRHPETGNLSHWPNDWDATYIVAAQPKVVRGLLDEIDRLNGLVIERETVRIGQSLQRHDDQKQIDELVALGIQQDKDEIARLLAENERWSQNYEHLIVQHMPRTGDGCQEGWSRVVEARELQAQVDQLKAENAELKAQAGLQVLLPELDEALEDLEIWGRHSDQGYRKLKDWYRKVSLACRDIDRAKAKEQ